MKDRLNFVIDTGLKVAAEQDAQRRGISVAEWFRRAALEKLAREGIPRGALGPADVLALGEGVVGARR